MWKIDPVSLRLFIAVCEEGSITKASEREFIVSSAISKRIADIESAYGITLLTRGQRGVSPTVAGETLLRHARYLMRSLERLHGDLLQHASGNRGRVRILANISSIVEFLPEELSEFILANPHIQVDFEERFSPEVIRGVAEGHADIGVFRESQLDTQSLQLLPYRQDHLAVVTTSDHPLAGRSSITFEETLDYEHLSLSIYATINNKMQRLAEQMGREMRCRTHVSSFDPAFRLVHNGVAIGIFPREAVGRYAKLYGLSVIPLLDEWALGRFQICIRDHESLSTPAKRLLEHLLSRVSVAAA
ncbi:LysR family transcriptional regulator [Pseudomonas sp. LRF_L74]|uniref:LysR family transcriptional regulator n=1 Tax=Pseudomonas sp. LRF_L74 TaxID=3369422 RepID=UPI003F5E20E1